MKTCIKCGRVLVGDEVDQCPACRSKMNHDKKLLSAIALAVVAGLAVTAAAFLGTRTGKPD